MSKNDIPDSNHTMSRPVRRHKKPGSFPPPSWSDRVFVEIDAAQVHMFRYLLEAHDNLGYMSVVDRWRAVLRVSFSPHQRDELHHALEGMRSTVPFTTLPSRNLPDFD